MSYIRIHEFSEAEQERMRKFIIDVVAHEAIKSFIGFTFDPDDSITLNFKDFHIYLKGGEITSAVIKKKKVWEKVWVNKLMGREK